MQCEIQRTVTTADGGSYFDIRQLPNISFKTGIRYESTTNYCIIHGIQLVSPGKH